MLWKLGITFLFIMLILPRIPDFGLGAPEALLPVQIQHTQAALFEALNKLLADLQADRDSRQ